MTAPKAIVFDVNGTLIDTVDLHAAAWVEALKHFGVEVPFGDMRLQIGKGGDQRLQGLLPPTCSRARERRSRYSAQICSSGCSRTLLVLPRDVQ